MTYSRFWNASTGRIHTNVFILAVSKLDNWPHAPISADAAAVSNVQICHGAGVVASPFLVVCFFCNATRRRALENAGPAC
jgi:hypothetical protein